MRIWTWILALLAAAVQPAAAQIPVTLHAHERLRVWVTHRARPVVGSLRDWMPTWLSVVPRGHASPRVYSFGELDAIEVSIGQSPVLRYATALSGTAFGAWLGATGRLESSRCRILGRTDPNCEWITPPAVVGGGFGLIISAIAGHFLLPERWRKLPVALGPGAVDGGVDAGVRFRF